MAVSQTSGSGAARKRRYKRQRVEGDDAAIDKVGEDLLRLALGTSNRQRGLGAQIETTILLPRDHPVVAILDEAGRIWKQASEAGTAERYGPPHLSQGTALLDWVAQLPASDQVTQVSKYKDFVQTLPVNEAARIVRQCWMTQTYDKPGGPKLNRIAFR